MKYLLVLCLLGLSASLLGGAERATHLFLAGDSTLAPKPPPPHNPERGWGEALAFFFDDSVVVDNRALNGRSSLSFRTEGHWDRLLADVRSGDWVLIQFGHNDQKSQDSSRYADAEKDYPANLRRFAEEVMDRGGQVILATPIVRRKFNEAGELVPTHGDYPAAVRAVAEEMDLPLLDLQAATREMVAELGAEASKNLYLWVPAGRYQRFPQGQEDDTHLSLLGASRVAQLAVEQIRQQALPLARHLESPTPDFGHVAWEGLYPDSEIPAPPVGATEQEEWNVVKAVEHPALATFRSTLGEAPRPAVVVCPGGGYSHLAMGHEGYDIARWFNSVGVDAYILKYRLKEFGYPAPLQDVARAIRTLRASADERGIDPQRIGVIGFSAGGHVAGMASTLWDSADNRFGDGLDAVSARPDFSVLAYGVLTMEEGVTHAGSRLNLLGPDADPGKVAALSLENQVSGETPPTFLMHTAADSGVPAENSVRYAQSLLDHDVPVALHLFTEGRHGIGMRPGQGPASEWPMLLAEWLVERGVVSAPK